MQPLVLLKSLNEAKYICHVLNTFCLVSRGLGLANKHLYITSHTLMPALGLWGKVFFLPERWQSQLVMRLLINVISTVLGTNRRQMRQKQCKKKKRKQLAHFTGVEQKKPTLCKLKSTQRCQIWLVDIFVWGETKLLMQEYHLCSNIDSLFFYIPTSWITHLGVRESVQFGNRGLRRWTSLSFCSVETQVISNQQTEFSNNCEERV